MSRDDDYATPDYDLEQIARLYLKWRASQSEEDKTALEARAAQYDRDCEMRKRGQEAESKRFWERVEADRAEAAKQRERNAMLDELIAKRKLNL